MPVTLPTWPGPKSASLRPVDAGTWQKPILGGDDVRLDRLGDRFALAVSLPPMKWHTIDGVSAARVWAARLARGVSEGVTMEVPQPDFDTSGFVFDAQCGASAAQSIVVPIASGLGQNNVFPEGMMVTLRKGATGKNYLHQLRAQAVSNAAGAANFSLWPRTRVAFGPGDTILLQTPVMDGRILDPAPIDMEEARTIGIAFEMQETA